MDNIRCFFGHKWEEKQEVIIPEFLLDLYTKNNLLGMYKTELFNSNVRFCKRCFKKQKEIGDSGLWISHKLSIEEEREIKLNELI